MPPNSPETDDYDPNQLLAQHGKSFYWARYFLGDEPSKNATQLYAFCRYLDDIADSKGTGNLEKLLEIKNNIEPLAKANIKNPQINAFLKLYNENKFDLSAVKDLLDGLISDQNDVQISDENVLIQYSYQVAGTVGLMMAPILNAENEEAFPFAVDLGIAMQLTNIARDVLEDAEYGRRYIPGILCNEMTPKEILSSASKDGSLGRITIIASIDHILAIAEKYYDSGLLGLTYLPVRNHIAIGIAAIVYRQIGRQLQKFGTQWWNGRQVISLVGKLVHSFCVIGTLFNRLQVLPKHDKTLHLPLKRFLYADGNYKY
jgi:phytoene synthase